MSTEANGTPQIQAAAEPAQAQPAAEPAAEAISEQQQIRRDKRERILADGREAYPVTVPVTHTIQQVREKYGDVEAGQMTGDVAAVAGRVLFIRNTGKLCFASLRAGDGTAVQAMLSLDRVGAAGLEQWKHDVDLGDHVWVRGEVGASRRGELSIFADEWGFAAKSLRPLPVAHKEMSEEARVRQRYVDLIMREEARVIARDRITALASLRSSLGARGFLEVETPILQTLQGGATARPFVTHMNAYDIDLFLRIAPELFLKRCVVGGIERVYEINRNFRNEGADSTHSPEFGMLEYYQAYGDYNDAARTTREIIQEAAQAVCGTLQVTHADGSIHDLSGEWTSISLYGAVSEAVGEEVTPLTPRSDLERLCTAAGLDINPNWLDGRLVEELLEHYVTPGFTGPTFVFDYPVDTSPLVRDHRKVPGLVEKWDLYVDGFELATGYSELVDPIIQRQRLEEQAARAAIDEESMPLDEDFLAALEHGMPPSAGVGLGIDRLLMALTGLGIRETILFPLVKPLALAAEKPVAAPAAESVAAPAEESVAAPREKLP